MLETLRKITIIRRTPTTKLVITRDYTNQDNRFCCNNPLAIIFKVFNLKF